MKGIIGLYEISLKSGENRQLGGELLATGFSLFPSLSPDGKTILFEEASARTCQTCDLDGKNVKPYAVGTKGYGFPAPSPDGKRILMMHFQQGKEPEPVIFPLGGTEGMPATTVPGLWTTPARR
jgi:Tol biopolymer transport system component